MGGLGGTVSSVTTSRPAAAPCETASWIRYRPLTSG